MKLLLMPWGRGLGHLTRILSIAYEAGQQENTNVTVVAQNEWSSLVEQTGARRVEYSDELTSGGPWDNWNDYSYVKKSLKADLRLLEMVNPDVVVHDVHFTMLLACELKGIPCITLVQYNMYPGFLFPGEGSDFWDSKLPAFKQVLKEYGLPTVTDIRELFFRSPVIIPSFPEFDVLPSKWLSKQVWYAGPLFYTNNLLPYVNTSVLTENLPLIFVYGPVQTQSDLELLIAAFKGKPFHLLVAGLNSNCHFKQSHDRFPYVTISGFVDATSTLKNCAAAIIHGGHGSCLAVLSSGTPTVVLPNPNRPEQEYNGILLERMGVAKCVSNHGRWERVYEAVQIVLSDTDYLTNAFYWKENQLKNYDGAKTVWRILSNFYSQKSQTFNHK